VSDADIEIRNAVEYLAKEGLELTVASVQKYLAEKSEFFRSKGITEVPADWIAPSIAEMGGPWPVYHGVQ
jgi:hypothetical protein